MNSFTLASMNQQLEEQNQRDQYLKLGGALLIDGWQLRQTNTSRDGKYYYLKTTD
jgi:hypothetical protein